MLANSRRCWRLRPGGLYAAAFLQSFMVTGTLVAGPWKVQLLGGSETAVGAVGGLLLGIYVAVCILIKPHLDRFRVKHLVITAQLATIACNVAMGLSGSVGWLLLAIGLQGVVLGGFWPPLTSWLSTGHEGKGLNRRLGMFNLSWSAGGILGWLGGGWLFDVHPDAPFFANAGMVALGLLITTGIRGRRTQASPSQEAVPTTTPHPRLGVYRQMARLALVSSYVAMGLRVPLASLIREIQLDATVHGLIVAAGNLLLTAMFVLLGRWAGWHYRRGLLWAVQVFGALVTAGVCLAGSAWTIGVLTALSSVTIAVCYTSHLYYAMSGGRRRAGVMALHESLLATGIVLGSFGGGALAGLIGIRWVFPVMGALMLLGLAGEVVLFLRAPDTTAPET